MLDVGLIKRALENGPGRSADEAVLNSVVQLSETGDHVRAAERAADLLADGYTDIRLVTTFALGAFEERGPESLPGILLALAEGLSLRWEILRPEARRPHVVDSALSVLFRTLKALIDFHEKTRGPGWQAWAKQITTPNLPDACKASADAIRAAVHAHIDRARCLGALAGVESRATECFHLLPPPPPEPPPASPPPEPEPEPEPEPDSVPPAAPIAAPSTEPAARTIEVSPALLGFLRKLDAFQQLMARNDLAKAAVVAEDIRSIVEHFDPRVYFPKLLTPHFRLLSESVAALAPHWEPMSNSPEAHRAEALTQLYKVDLDAFLEP